MAVPRIEVVYLGQWEPGGFGNARPAHHYRVTLIGLNGFEFAISPNCESKGEATALAEKWSQATNFAVYNLKRVATYQIVPDQETG